MIELHCLIRGEMLGADRFRPASRGAENGFIGQGNGFVRRRPKKSVHGLVNNDASDTLRRPMPRAWQAKIRGRLSLVTIRKTREAGAGSGISAFPALSGILALRGVFRRKRKRASSSTAAGALPQ
jgi:hypothetical protein